MPIFGWKLSCDFLNKGHLLQLALKNRLTSACDPIAPLHMLQRFMLPSTWRHNVTSSFSSPAVVVLFHTILSPLGRLSKMRRRLWIQQVLCFSRRCTLTCSSRPVYHWVTSPVRDVAPFIGPVRLFQQLARFGNEPLYVSMCRQPK